MNLGSWKEGHIVIFYTKNKFMVFTGLLALDPLPIDTKYESEYLKLNLSMIGMILLK
jgi:hypothetical protein